MRRTTIAARVVVLLIGVGVSLVTLAGLASAQATPPTPPPATTAQPPAAEPPGVVSRRILPDGAVEITYSDGTTRRVTPDPGSGSTPTTPSAGDALTPVSPPEWLKDSATNSAFLEAMGEYYRYRTSGLRHRSRVFEWQLASSKVIFATVLMLVSAGMVFAAIQFRAGLKRPIEAPSEAATQIDLSTAGVKVSSPVLGVIILVISLAFFYLYLVYVYPISEIV